MDTWIHQDGDKTIFESRDDLAPHLKRVKELRDGGGKGKDMHHVGSIPNVIIEQYCNKVGITYRDFLEDKTHVMRILNDADYKEFRVLT